MKKQKTKSCLQIIANLNKGLTRRAEMLDGQAYTVYPVVMMRAGVLNGVLYTQEEISKFPASWNGIPVPVYHPEKDGSHVSCNSPDVYEDYVVGKIYNTRVEGDKLKAEVWIKNSKINKVAPNLLAYIESGGELDVSTGLFCEEILQSGTFQDKEYTSIGINIRPDHLALLPGQMGACSWQDGCGIRNNQKEDNMKKDEARIICSLNTNEMEYMSLVSAVRGKLDAMDMEGIYYYPKQIMDNSVIYVKEDTAQGKTTFFERQYEMSADKIEWTSDPVEVEMTFVQKTNSNQDGAIKRTIKPNKENKMKKEDKTKVNQGACCPEKVEELIANSEKFTEDDRETLLSMTQDQLDLLLKANEVQGAKKPEVDPKEPKSTAPVVNADEGGKSFDELLSMADPATRQAIEFSMGLMTNYRKQLVDLIKANSTEFTDDELAGMDLKMLDKISKAFGKGVKANSAVSVFYGQQPKQPEIQVNDADGIEPLPVPAWDFSKTS